MQALYDEGEIIMDQVLVCLHGDDHRKRRKVEKIKFFLVKPSDFMKPIFIQ